MAAEKAVADDQGSAPATSGSEDEAKTETKKESKKSAKEAAKAASNSAKAATNRLPKKRPRTVEKEEEVAEEVAKDTEEDVGDDGKKKKKRKRGQPHLSMSKNPKMLEMVVEAIDHFERPKEGVSVQLIKQYIPEHFYIPHLGMLKHGLKLALKKGLEVGAIRRVGKADATKFLTGRYITTDKAGMEEIETGPLTLTARAKAMKESARQRDILEERSRNRIARLSKARARARAEDRERREELQTQKAAIQKAKKGRKPAGRRVVEEYDDEEEEEEPEPEEEEDSYEEADDDSDEDYGSSKRRKKTSSVRRKPKSPAKVKATPKKRGAAKGKKRVKK